MRRLFTAEYKNYILATADACARPAELAAPLQRAGLYAFALAGVGQENLFTSMSEFGRSLVAMASHQ